MAVRTHLLVMAKEPRPGFAKTRLMPAYDSTAAAAVAAAALADTLRAVAACSARRRIVAFAGLANGWVPSGFEVVPQSGETFNDRLAAAWDFAGAPGVQIGMDTPQVSSELLDDALARVARPDVDALLGLCPDGGWWAIGFRTPVAGAFDGVPMSRDDTGARQLARLRELGLRVELLPELADMDRPADLDALRTAHPHLLVAQAAQRYAGDKVAP